jgi:hypothetical protein
VVPPRRFELRPLPPEGEKWLEPARQLQKIPVFIRDCDQRRIKQINVIYFKRCHFVATERDTAINSW